MWCVLVYYIVFPIVGGVKSEEFINRTKKEQLRLADEEDRTEHLVETVNYLH